MRIPICGCETNRLPSVTLVVRINLESQNYILTQNRHVTKKSTNIKTITHTLTQESYTPPMSIYQPLMCYHILFFNSPLQPGNLWSETMFHDWYSCKDGIFMNRRANSSYFHEAGNSATFSLARSPPPRAMRVMLHVFKKCTCMSYEA